MAQSLFTFDVWPDGDEPFEVEATGRDVLVWERTSRGKTTRDLLERMPFDDLYKIAHLAATRHGLYTGTLDEFRESCDISPRGQNADAELDPTQPDHSPDS